MLDMKYSTDIAVSRHLQQGKSLLNIPNKATNEQHEVF